MVLGFSWITPEELDPNSHIRRSLRNLGKNYPDEFVEIPLSKLNSLALEKKVEKILFIGTTQNVPLEIINYLLRPRERECLFWSLEDPYDIDWNIEFAHLFDRVYTVEKNSTLLYETRTTCNYLPLAIDHTELQNFDLKRIENQLSKSRTLIHIGTPYENRKEFLKIFSDLYLRRNDIQYQLIHIGDLIEESGKHLVQKGRLPFSETANWDAKSLASLVLGRDFDYANSVYCSPAGSVNGRFFESCLNGNIVAVDKITMDIGKDFSSIPSVLNFVDPLELIEYLGIVSKDMPKYARSILERKKMIASDHSYLRRLRYINDF